ncbi:MAG: tRNA adenosine(34) deaminase TadA [Gammaproteobacteria bacterium]|nr:tRNA adenosine(34) deaminase TadA [Gammaproteobacteria bacterium]
MTQDQHWMNHALRLAREGAALGEVPVGAVVVDAEGRLLGEGFNQPIGAHDPTAHAEIVALRQAAQRTGNYRLQGASLYVTLEPCLMCCGALVHARIQRLVYGATESKAGAVESAFGVLRNSRLNHRVEVKGGVLAEASSEVLRDFFAARREIARTGARGSCSEPDSD